MRGWYRIKLRGNRGRPCIHSGTPLPNLRFTQTLTCPPIAHQSTSRMRPLELFLRRPVSCLCLSSAFVDDYLSVGFPIIEHMIRLPSILLNMPFCFLDAYLGDKRNGQVHLFYEIHNHAFIRKPNIRLLGLTTSDDDQNRVIPRRQTASMAHYVHFSIHSFRRWYLDHVILYPSP